VGAEEATDLSVHISQHIQDCLMDNNDIRWIQDRTTSPK
jgi:hypothetical protein